MHADELIEAAQQATGHEDFDATTFREPLDLLVTGINARDDYTSSGLDMVRGEMVEHLSNRLRVAAYLRDHPEVLDAPLDVALVIMGMPRTGTTAVSYLLDCDAQWRSLLNWEAFDSVPPATSETLRTDPRCIARKQIQEKIHAAIPVEPPHWEWADGPTECIFVQSQDFKSLLWESRAPSRDYAEYILECDMKSAYDYQIKVLKILQSKAPGRWVLKMPSHSLHFQWALQAFPNAKFIWTHRDPYQALASLGTTISSSHASLFSEVDRPYIHDVYPKQMAEHLNRPLRARASLVEEKILDVYSREFLREPIEGIRQIYHWLGEELSPAVEKAMSAWLETDRQRQSKRPSYQLEDFGWSKPKVTPFFEEYLDHYASKVLGK